MVITQKEVDDAIMDRLLIVNGCDCEVNVEDWEGDTTIDEIIDYMCLKYDLEDQKYFNCGLLRH